MANAGGHTENLATRKSHAFRNRFLSELKSEIKYLTNAFKIFYFIICSIPISSVLRILVQLEKHYQQHFFMITTTIRGFALITSVFGRWTSHFHHKPFKCCLSSKDFW